VLTIDFERLRQRHGGADGRRILDVGCGSGRHTAEACRYPHLMVVGADLCLEDLQQARERLEYHERLGINSRGPWTLTAADITRLPFAGNSFDWVVCSEVLEHIESHRLAVGELLRVLRPGGLLAVSVPRRWPECICWALSNDYRNASGGHVRIYRRRHLLTLLTAAGAVPWAEHHAHSLHTPYWWLKCLLGPNREDCRTVNLYHRFLTWELMRKPRAIRLLDRLLNPVLGKSLVVYLRKPN
jgi:ubiquinone/menaquinone biosynthesis C-methylase UbiE